MPKTCLKCGHVSTASDTRLEAECPRCGAIYAKVEKAMAARSAAPTTPEGKPKRITPKPGARLLILCAIAASLIGYLLYTDHQKDIEAKARAERLAAYEAAQEKARQQQREAVFQARVREEAARRAAMSPFEIREESVKGQFSPWDGSHIATKAAIKARMHNPDSFEHVKTTYFDNGSGNGLTIQTVFRGTNSFGAIVMNVAIAKVDDTGAVLSLTMR